MTEGGWFDAFPMNPVFSREEFARYRRAVESALPFYEHLLPKGARVLNLGCGLGVFSIPLSTFGYRIVGVDNDPRVVEAASQNARNFGGDYRVVQGDVFDIVDLFGPNSFDACDSGGLLEHFDRDKVRSLVERQLTVAPLLIASMPVKTEATLRSYRIQDQNAEGNVDAHGIYRNFWDQRTWVEDVLHDFHVVENFVERASPAIGEFDELTVVIDRTPSR